MGYDAFISYSHAADGLFAPRLQAGLQRFAKPWYRRRALDVFRDETGLSVNPALWTSITTALDDSRFFVLLASPDAASSVWVNREVEHWLTHNSVDTILPILTDGEIRWDEATGDFDWSVTDAVPAALAGAFVEEPRYMDWRWAKDETQLDLRNGRFRDQIAELAAPMHGKAKDQLIGEELLLHRRAMRLAWATGCVLVILLLASIAGMALAVRNANQAAANEAAANEASQQARDNAALAEANAGEAQRQKHQADTNAAEAERQKNQANANAAEAQNQQNQAEANAAEAQRRKSEAEANAAEAQRQQSQAELNAFEARQQRLVADANAQRALQQQELAELNAAEAANQALLANQRADTIQQQNDQITVQNGRILSQSDQITAQNAQLATTNDNLQVALADATYQASVALAHSLAANAGALAATQLDTALLLAVEGHRLIDDTETRTGLLAAHNQAPLLRELHQEFGGVNLSTADVSGDGTVVAATDLTRGIGLYDLSTRARRPVVFETPPPVVTFLRLSPGGASLAAGTASGSVLLWNTSTGKLVLTMGGSAATMVRDGTFDRTGSRFAFVSEDGVLRVWDLHSGLPLAATDVRGGEPASQPWSVALSPDGTVAVAGTDDGRVVAVDAATGAIRWSAQTGYRVLSLAFSPSGTTVAAGDSIGFVSFVAASNGAALGDHVSFSLNEDVIALSFVDDTVVLVGGESGAIGRFVLTDRAWLAPLRAHRGAVWRIVNTSGRIASVGSSEVATWSLGAPWPLLTATAEPSEPRGTALSPDGRIASFNAANQLELRAPRSATATFLTVPGRILSSRPSFTGDGRRVAVGLDQDTNLATADDRVVGVFDVATGALARQIPVDAPGRELLTVVVGPGDRIAVGGASGVTAIDGGTTITASRTLPRGFTNVSIAWAPGGAELAVGSGVAVNFLDAITLADRGNQPADFNAYVSRSGIAYQPGADRVAIALDDGNIHVLAASTHLPVGPPVSLKPSGLSSVAFSPDGRLLAVGANDGTIRLVDAATLRSIGPALTTTGTPVRDVVFLDGGSTLLTTSERVRALLYRDLSPTSWETAACAVAGRNLSIAEWNRYLPGQAYRRTCPQWAPGT